MCQLSVKMDNFYFFGLNVGKFPNYEHYFSSNIAESWVEAEMSCVEVGGAGWRWMELGGGGWSWVELGGTGWSWVEVDGAGWRWVHGLVILFVFVFESFIC